MSKLSLHISDWLDPDIAYDFIGDTRPPVVKVFGNVALNDTKIAVAKQRSPTTTFVGRMYFEHQEIERDELAPRDSVFNYNAVADARNAFNQMREIVDKLRGLVDVWEGYNEIPIDTPEPLTEREFQKARNYNAFTVEMARLMHDAGMKYAAYSFSTGNPVHVELWDLLVDGLRASDYLALHEYIAPNQAFTEFNTTMCNKYREAYARIPADARKPILITECGVDYNGERGFKDRVPLPEYLRMLGDYDRELMRDSYVVGATIFCYGIDNKRWQTYDIGGPFTRVLREYILATPTPPLETPVIVEPPPTRPAEPALLRLVEVFGLAKQARDKLEQGDGEGARAILKDSVVPWFYATAAQHSPDLPNAHAHTTARWFGEEASRRIEAGKNQEARDLIDSEVLTWLQSPGPRALGILSATAPARKLKAVVKKARAKTGLGVLSASAKPKRSAAKKKTAAKPKRRSTK
mgnify:CR=1 FL=1